MVDSYRKAPRGLGELWEVDEQEWERVWDERRRRVWSVLDALSLPTGDSKRESAQTSSKLRFSSFPTSHQRLTLLARALVAHVPIVILDEVWSGMDEESAKRVRGYLRDSGPEGAFRRDQAVVVVTHWVGEVPWVQGRLGSLSWVVGWGLCSSF
ncbi:hypothetical protein BDQ17DRAFT_1049930 [Cyathus striatus]|nr:hypothetical protein BDQ17DRAFT_1049930 [Cyathus striatus]